MVVGFPYLVRTVLDLSAALYGIAESALGVAAVLGGVCVGLLGERLRLGRLAGVFSGFGLCLLPCGLAFLLPWEPWAVWVLVAGSACASLVQLLLHLCYRRHPGADPSGAHGEGDVLCVHHLPLRPAPGAAGVWRPV
mgnify:CR=1 FL=1